VNQSQVNQNQVNQSPVNQGEDDDDLEDRIRQVSTEIRMVLPGAQALLGFQFITFVLSEFDKLPQLLKEIHVVSSTLLTLSVILLMTPAAYHRIVEQGENSEHFHRFASVLLLSALVPLALGISGDFFVVIEHVMGSAPVAVLLTMLLLCFFFGCWFALPLLRRRRDRKHAQGERRAPLSRNTPSPGA
jgi:hypothetical protein